MSKTEKEIQAYLDDHFNDPYDENDELILDPIEGLLYQNLKFLKDPIVPKWIAALREDRPQSNGALKVESKKNDTVEIGHCCLGVLCEVHPDVKFKADAELSDDYLEEGALFWARFPTGEESELDLPTRFREQLGIYEGLHQGLMRMNDDGCTFHDIADLLEFFVERAK